MSPIDDFRRAARRLRSNRGTLALSVAMLALAIGVTTAMFTVLDALMLHPVPFRDAERLTSVVVAKEGMFMLRGAGRRRSAPGAQRRLRGGRRGDAVAGRARRRRTASSRRPARA